MTCDLRFVHDPSQLVVKSLFSLPCFRSMQMFHRFLWEGVKNSLLQHQRNLQSSAFNFLNCLLQCLVLGSQQKGAGYCLVDKFLPLYSTSNSIHEKISPFWLVKSSAVFFKTVQKRVNSVQKEVTNQAFWLHWSMIKETQWWPITSFAFKSSTCPGWHNWWCNFSLITWYTCVSSAQPSRNFFIYIINK